MWVQNTVCFHSSCTEKISSLEQVGVGDNLSLKLCSIKYGRTSHIIAVAFRTGTLLSIQSCSVKFKLFFWFSFTHTVACSDGTE